MLSPRAAALFVALVGLPTLAPAEGFEPPFVMPHRSTTVDPDAKLTPTPGGPPADLAFGAYQRGYFLTALREATQRVAANPKDAAAMTLIAEIYRDGLAVKQDFAEATHWLALASRNGDANAQFELGVMMLDGASGVARDRKGAQAQFEKAAAQGHPASLYNLGVLAIDVEKGQQPDLARAAGYFKRAAQAGDGAAAYSYGVQLREGRGVALDISESARWLKVAADEGVQAGQVEYAIMLFNGVGVVRDEEEAARIFLLAAAHRNPIAENRLAHIYLSGRGAPKDIVKAALWHNLAKAAGEQDEALDKALVGLDADQLRELARLTMLQKEF